MPRFNHFSAWIQRGSERFEEYDVQYTPEQRTVTCWIADANDPKQDFKYVCWKSDGLGHPSRIRLSTERAKVNPCHLSPQPPERTPFMPLSLVANGDCDIDRKPQISECKECAEVAAALDGKICTIKVEIFFHSTRMGFENASGSLPLNEDDAPKNGIKKVSPGQPPMSASTPATFHPMQGRDIGSLASVLPITPSTRPGMSTITAEPYVTFYFRCRSREVLISHGIIRSRSYPLRKRSRSPSPCANDFQNDPSSKRSRSAPSELGDDDTSRLGSPIIPYYECSKTKTIAVPRPSYPPYRGTGSIPTTRMVYCAPLSSAAMDRPSLVTDAHADKDREIASKSDSESDDELLSKLEQRILETHQMLLKLKTRYHRRRHVLSHTNRVYVD